MTKVIYFGNQPKNSPVKPIEFVKCLKRDCNSFNEGREEYNEILSKPSKFKYIDLISEGKSYAYDIMAAYDYKGGPVTLFFGYWNDGVKSAPKLKPIQFEKIVYSNGTIEDASLPPSRFDVIEVLSINAGSGYDKFYCYDAFNRNDGALFLGHLNDGVVK